MKIEQLKGIIPDAVYERIKTGVVTLTLHEDLRFGWYRKSIESVGCLYIQPDGSISSFDLGCPEFNYGDEYPNVFFSIENGSIVITNIEVSVSIDRTSIIPLLELDSTPEITTTQAFNTFWKAYPFRTSGGQKVKSGKQKAKEQFDRQFKASKMSLEAFLEHVLKAVEKWKQTDAWKQGYVKDAFRWLREQGFNDEVERTHEHKCNGVRTAVSHIVKPEEGKYDSFFG